MNPVVLDRLTLCYRKTLALDGVSFELPKGTVTALLGHNGAGKSTLMQALLGLLKPTSGTVRVLGADPIREGTRVRTRVGYVPDTCDAPEWVTSGELFRFLAPQYDRWDSEQEERLIERFELPLDTPLRGLSRGQRAKSMLLAAMAPRPDVLLLDETFSGLDPVARHELLGGFLDELRLDEVCVLTASHDLDLVSRVADRVILLADGQVRADGPLEEVLAEWEDAPLPQALHTLMEAHRSGRMAS